MEKVRQFNALQGGYHQSLPVVIQGMASVLTPHLQDREEGTWSHLLGPCLSCHYNKIMLLKLNHTYPQGFVAMCQEEMRLRIKSISPSEC